jgi:hypothetical protein
MGIVHKGPTGIGVGLGGLASDSIAILEDQKGAAVAGGTFTAGAWRTRDLNTENDPGGIVTLAANQFTLQAGTYLIEAVAPSNAVNRNQIRLQNITDATTDGIGGSIFSRSTSGATSNSNSLMTVTITIASAKVFEIQHQGQTTKTSNGFGTESNLGLNSVYTRVGITKLDVAGSGLLASTSIATLEDQKAPATAGGTFTLGVFRTRDLNTEDDPGGIVTLAANQFTLQAGTYFIRASAPADRVDSHQTRLQNITDATTDIIGSSEFADAGIRIQTRSVLEGRITITSPKVFELQHRSTATRAVNGFGIAANVGLNELYSEVEIIKLDEAGVAGAAGAPLLGINAIGST